jgi:hypothetical protein
VFLLTVAAHPGRRDGADGPLATELRLKGARMQRRPQMSRRPSVGGRNPKLAPSKPPAPRIVRLQSRKRPQKPTR